MYPVYHTFFRVDRNVLMFANFDDMPSPSKSQTPFHSSLWTSMLMIFRVLGYLTRPIFHCGIDSASGGPPRFKISFLLCNLYSVCICLYSDPLFILLTSSKDKPIDLSGTPLLQRRFSQFDRIAVGHCCFASADSWPGVLSTKVICSCKIIGSKILKNLFAYFDIIVLINRLFYI